MIERKIGEIFEARNGKLVICVKAASESLCRGCIYASTSMVMCGCDNSIGVCSPLARSDGNSVIFMKVENSIANDIKTLERIAKEYSGKTIENIIVQLKSRLRETTHIS